MDSPLYKRQFLQQYKPKDYYHSQEILSREVSKQFPQKTEKNTWHIFSSNISSLFPESVTANILRRFRETTSFWRCIGIQLHTISSQEKEAEDDMGCASCFRWIHIVTGCSLHPKVQQMVEHLVLDFSIFSGCWSYDFSCLLLDQPVF